ncbi:MAG TPA: undecaprenyldiphospho-muramoylpentapeptide beta-N-acetylglucosaminyltransferase [Aeromonadales bacterium]|nr:undecaprenyldiphospho-muramoylpentapeptide beta-N-acetylglucosaminyltransferase [Aeromonadales bacterium]
MTLKRPALLVMAGGTGGHIFPGIAVAKALAAKGWSIHWLGSRNSMEEQIVPRQNIALTTLQVSGIRGSGFKRKLLAPFTIVKAIFEARKCIKQIAPDLVIGMGGFASGPGGIAAWISGVPLIIHEQNAIAGYTNRILAKVSTRIACAFPDVFAKKYAGKITRTGNPVREEICQLPPPSIRLENRSGLIRLLIVGGSRGAQILNEVIPETIAQCKNSFSIRHQCGRGNLKLVDNRYQQAKDKGHQLQVSEFIENMAEALNWADLIICRSGALTISEIMCVGLGSVLVPYPYAVDDHQSANGLFLKQKKAALMIKQQDLNAGKLASWLDQLTHKLATEMAIHSYDEQAKLATEKLASLCESTLEGRAA